MRKVTKLIASLVAAASLTVLGAVNATAQDSTATESSIGFDAGMDIYSSYIFRGVKFGNGPAFQPWVEFTAGNFALGAWGSACSGGFDGENAGEAAEMDLYAGYSFPFGLYLGATDYYYPGSEYFDYEFTDSTGSHGLEINAAYEIGGLSLAANYIPMQAANAATVGGDMYFEIGYAFDKFSIFAGAGDGWHSSDTEFQFVNAGISTEKEIQITDKFSLPLTGSVILNPDQEQFYITVGVSL